MRVVAKIPMTEAEKLIDPLEGSWGHIDSSLRTPALRRRNTAGKSPRFI